MSALDLLSEAIMPAVTIPEAATIEQATSLMSFAGLPAVILVCPEGHPVGVLGRLELVAAIAGGTRNKTTLAEASRGMDAYPQIDGDASPAAVLRLALATDCETVMLTKAGKVVGFLDLIDVLKAAENEPPH